VKNSRKQQRSSSAPLDTPSTKKHKKKQQQEPEASTSKQPQEQEQQQQDKDVKMSNSDNVDELSAALIEQLQNSFGASYNPGARMRTYHVYFNLIHY